uniref:DNA-directed DNA polymerase n=1 Tax=Siphoviridae sp. ctrpg19 TaxID=2826481 RepID=A0A8S5MKA1_9CAUD|nr:MAG TPA: DNA polymerase III, delta subunit [Siphoviridae sp. ctrpg19]
MELQELSNALKNNSNIESFYIFLNTENTFLSNQYIEEISKVKSLSISYVDELKSLVPDKNDIFGCDVTLSENTLYVYKTDEFVCNDISIKNVKNLIIVCNKIEKNTAELFKKFIIEMPKLQEWQIKDYVYSLADGVDHRKLDWLISICNKDIYRIDNELSKIKIFNKKDRDDVFNQFAEEGAFSDLSNIVVFDLTSAILKRDAKRTSEILEDIKNFNCEPFGVLTLLLNSFRNVINIQLSRDPSAVSLGMKPAQFYAIQKNNCGVYTKEQLVTIFELLSKIEFRVKMGELPVELLIDYMVTNIFAV